MNRREKRMLFALGIVIVISIPFLPIWGGSETAVGTQGRAGSAARSSTASTNAEEGIPELRTDILKRQPKQFSGTKRNLFAYDKAPKASGVEEGDIPNVVPETGEGAAGTVPNNGGEQQREEKNPRLKDYALTGFLVRENESYAVFLWKDKQHFYGKVGETVNKDFTIEEIGKDFVKILAIKGNFRQRINLPAPAGVTKTGEEKS